MSTTTATITTADDQPVIDVLHVAATGQTRQRISDEATDALIATTRTATAPVRLHIRQDRRLIFHGCDDLAAVLVDLALWGRDSDGGAAS